MNQQILNNTRLQPVRRPNCVAPVDGTSRFFTLATIRVLVLLVTISTTSEVFGQDPPELVVEIDRQQIYQGEAFIYRLTLNHVDKPTQPDLTQLKDFQATLLSDQSINSQQITIINGRRNEIVRRGHQYTYRLVPKRSGQLTIPAPTVEIDGQTLTGQAVNVQVTAPQEQDLVLLNYSVDRTSVYPMQPLTVTLIVSVKALPEPFGDQDPLTVQPQPPVLTIPWMDDNQVSAGLQPQQSWKSILEPMISRRGHGLQINSIASSSASWLFESRATAFLPQAKQTQRLDGDGNDVEYWDYTFTRTFVPTETGVFHLGQITLKGSFGDRSAGNGLSGTDVYAMADDVSITAKEVPTEGQPPSYIGAIGTFQTTATLTPLSARVGDPMTLTLTLTGDGTLADARPPQIGEVPEVASRFRTYEATEDAKGRERRFIYSLRPLSSDVSEFPAIPVAYFDVDAERYVTLHTEAIPVTVSQAETLAASEIVASDASSGPGDSALQRNSSGIFANITQAETLRNEGILPFRWFTAWGVMIAVAASCSWGIGYIRERAGNPVLARQRNAPAAAAAALSTATTHVSSGDTAAACDSLRQALGIIVGAWANVPEQGLTARDAADQLERLGVPPQLSQDTEQLLEACDAARYGAAGADTSQMIAQAQELVKELVCQLRRDRSLTS